MLQLKLSKRGENGQGLLPALPPASNLSDAAVIRAFAWFAEVIAHSVLQFTSWADMQVS